MELISEKTIFKQQIVVSHEATKKLDRYAELLVEWNQKFNLVAESTLSHIWTRHFLDSAQLFRHIPKDARILADLGSGAGFPGLVLSIMGFPEVHLIESTGKKANFLRAVIADLGLKAEVHQRRAEDIKDLQADIITARAVGGMRDLLRLSKPLMKKGSLCLFLKGKNAREELTESAKSWTFESEIVQSLSDDSGNVLIIRNPKFKNAAPHKKRR